LGEAFGLSDRQILHGIVPETASAVAGLKRYLVLQADERLITDGVSSGKA